MRISDWSSDVCSSDLMIGLASHEPARLPRQIGGDGIGAERGDILFDDHIIDAHHERGTPFGSFVERSILFMPMAGTPMKSSSGVWFKLGPLPTTSIGLPLTASLSEARGPRSDERTKSQL